MTIDQSTVDREVLAIIGTPKFKNAIEKETPADRDRVVMRIHKDTVKKLLVSEVFRTQVETRVEIGPTDVRDYYDAHPQRFRTPGRVLARAVVVKSGGERTDSDLERVAGQIEAGVNSGRSLEDAAGPFLDVGLVRGPVDLGWIEPGQLEPELEQALWTIEVGKVVAPFPSDGGLHVLQAAQREEGITLPFEEVEAKLTAQMRFASFSDELAKYLFELETRYKGERDATTEIPSVRPSPAKADAALAASPALPSPAPQSPAVHSPTPQPVVRPPAGDSRGSLIEPAVLAWAQAWSAQDVDGYIGAYSQKFQPGKGLDRAAWATQRRERVAKPEFIRVEVHALRTEVAGDRATATFRQAYASGNYSDEVTKILRDGLGRQQLEDRVREITVAPYGTKTRYQKHRNGVRCRERAAVHQADAGVTPVREPRNSIRSTGRSPSQLSVSK